MTGNSGEQITGYYLPSTAPTTTGCCYECAGGSQWRPAEPFEKHDTGLSFGVKIGDRIYPQTRDDS